MFLPHFDIICDLSDAWIFYFKIFHHYSKAGLCPIWQNEAVSLVVMRSKELWKSRKIVPLSNLTWTASRGMKTYCKSRIELQNPQFLSPMQPFELKSLDATFNIAGVERIRMENLRLWSTPKAIRLEFWMKGALEMAEICVLCGWWFSNQFNIVSETCYSYNTVGRELYWSSYTLLTVVHWNGLEHSCQKARLCVYCVRQSGTQA